MKILCNAKRLADAFVMVASVVPARADKEVLRNVKIAATKEDGGRLTLSGTDLEISIKAEVSADSANELDVAAPGSLLLPVARTAAILREMDGVITISSNGSRSQLVGGSSRFSLQAESVDDYPDPEIEFGESRVELPSRALATMLRRTMFVCDEESSRYALGAVNIETEGDTVIAVGSDGRRMAVADTVRTGGEGDIKSGTALIPVRAAKLVERALSSRREGTVEMAVTFNDITIRCDGILIRTRMVEGKYPVWTKVLPDRDSLTGEASLLASPFLTAVRQAAIATSAETNGVVCTFETGKVTLEASSTDVGESSVELPAPCDTDEPQAIKMDHRYLSQMCGVLDAEANVTAHFRDGNTPVLFESDGYRYVLMPMTK